MSYNIDHISILSSKDFRINGISLTGLRIEKGRVTEMAVKQTLVPKKD